MQADLSRRTHDGLVIAPGGGAPRRRRRRRARRGILGLLAALLVLALPVPWLHVVSDDPPGHAWRLDGRLYIEGDAVDPPGRWSWLAVGRPALVGEVLRDRVLGNEDPPVDMRAGARTQRPALSEPAAVTVGLRHAGRDLPMRLLVEASQPIYEGLPERIVITEVYGVALTNRAAWDRVSHRWAPGLDLPVSIDERPTIEFASHDGRSFTAPGPALPYDRIDILDLAPLGLEAGIANPLTRLAPVSWWRDLSLGSSHGLMVALLAYSDAAGHDLAQTRHVAGTGGIRGDGTVTRIGGLPAKARAAKRAGADVLLFPASQVGELETFDPGRMQLLPVTSLEDAVERLSRPLA